ncbi:DUF6603 domain-containing protein [uncultured Prevotella sp.]|uniref:DUF6603 domain-containing protein n=1 Tax=uncultured Prevotella sp. TaxID=159272 RepID=UPI0025EE8DF3|nr:DUF6603 domain-containing protein [uncultured Prevotella sp.]
MTTGEIIIKKLQQLLAMTKDSLVADVEREFGWIRTAFLEGAEATNNAKTRKDQYEQIEKMVDAIFTQLGYDLSQYENITDLRRTVKLFLGIADKMDNLASSYNDASNKGFDEESTATFLLNAGGVAQDILGFYKDLQNIEIRRIEMDDAVDGEEVFKLETLHRLFDHIIIALLKNAKVVFKDEIDYLENLVSQTETAVTVTVESLKMQLRNELGIAEKEMTVFMDDTLSDLRKVESNVGKQLEGFTRENREALLKFYRTINSIYAVLDFLGIIGDAEIEIKIPKEIQKVYGDIQEQFAKTVSDIQKSATEYADSSINGAIKTVSEVAKEAKDAITATEAYKTLNEEFPIQLEQLDMSPGNYVMLAQVNSILDDAVNKSGKTTQYLSKYSYTYKYKTIRWSSLEKLFSEPVSYFKELYPVECADDVQEVMKRILDIAHTITPKIPDFSTLRNMLEDLLRNLERRVIQFLTDKGKEVAKKVWAKVRPVIATIKQVIQMLKEMALRLKEDIETVINGVYADLQKTFGEVYNTIKAELDNAAKDIEAKVKEIENSVKDIADVVERNALDVINDVKGGINDIGKEFSAIDKELKNIEVQAARAIAKVFALLDDQTKLNSLVLEPAYNETLKVELEKYGSDAEAVFKEVEPKLNLWAVGVKASVVNFVNPKSWEQRLAVALTDMQKCMKEDINKIGALMSKEGARQLLTEHGMTMRNLKKELDINDYVNIVYSSVSDVVIPNPKAYYSSLRSIIEDAAKSLKDKMKDDVKNIDAIIRRFVNAVWRNIRREILEPVINNLKKLLLEIVRKQIVNKLLRLVNDAVKSLSDRFPSLNNVSIVLREIDKELKERELVLNDPELPQKLRKYADKQVRMLVNQGIDEAGKALGEIEISVPLTYVLWMKEVLEETIRFTTSNKTTRDVVIYVIALYKSIPQEVKDEIADLLPSLPDFHVNEGLKNYVKSIDTQYDLNNRVACFTLLDVKTPSDKNQNVDAACKLQVLMFVGNYSPGEDKESLPALYFCSAVSASADFNVPIGQKHVLRLGANGSVGQMTDNVSENTDFTQGQALGFCLTKGGTFHGLLDVDNMGGLFYVRFERKDSSAVVNIVNTEYVDFGIRNYPQLFYVGYKRKPSDPAKYTDSKSSTTDKDNGLTLGYYGGIEDLELRMKLSANSFFKMFLKDDPTMKISTSLLYDMQNGLKIDGGAKFHLDFDISKLEIGPVKFDKLSVDLGNLSGSFGDLGMTLGSTFALDFSCLTMSFENLGISFDINFLKPDGSLGDYDFSGSFKFPNGIGISIETPVVKGAGLISYDKSEGTLFSALSLEVLKKFTVGCIVDADLGVKDGHCFSLVALISTSFSPGIPLGMGFSLNGVGGCLGLNRMYDADAVSGGVRSGVFGSVFFVDNVMNHLTEMKTAVKQFFPEKKKQFFLGVLCKICFEPVVTCEFGLLIQAPNPMSIGIVGALKVRVGDTNLIKINVYFFGEIDFDKGLRFDASIVDSEIVGLKLEGDMAFRLFWGGPYKGFGLSIGGFHPAYKPEEGLKFAPNMRRLSLSLNYDIVKIKLETYLAVTSNSFQIGARLDLNVGWEEFGLIGYAGFDALFVFKPFRFSFSLEIGVAVMVGSAKLFSVDLALSVEGPAKWRVKGKAYFTVLFIPVKCKFSLAWGDSPKEERRATIAVWKDVLLPELLRDNNWITSSAEQNNDGKEKDVNAMLTLQPNDTFSFNQSAVPFDYPMGLCNDALPEDFTSFRLKKVSIIADNKEFSLETSCLNNDFAPSLYKELSNEERLSNPSYESVTSGFEAKDNNAVSVMSFDGNDFVEAQTKFYVKECEKELSGNRKSRNVLHIRNDKASFRRYVKNLDTKV